LSGGGALDRNRFLEPGRGVQASLFGTRGRRFHGHFGNYERTRDVRRVETLGHLEWSDLDGVLVFLDTMAIRLQQRSYVTAAHEQQNRQCQQ
jgi:hypothetical protein